MNEIKANTVCLFVCDECSWSIHSSQIMIEFEYYYTIYYEFDYATAYVCTWVGGMDALLLHEEGRSFTLFSTFVQTWLRGGGRIVSK